MGNGQVQAGAPGAILASLGCCKAGGSLCSHGCPVEGERSEGLISYGTSFSLQGHPLVLEGVGVLTHSGAGIVALLASPRLPPTSPPAGPVVCARSAAVAEP